MKGTRRFMGVAALSAVIAFSAAAPASAEVTNPNGNDYWDHGVNNSTVWSNYYNDSKTWHKSSVQSGGEGYTSSPWMDRWTWSYASQTDDFWGTDYSYYNYIA